MREATRTARQLGRHSHDLQVEIELALRITDERQRRRVLARIGEKPWQQLIKDYARLCGWWVYHNHDARKSDPGFPDLFLVRPPVQLWGECKREKGALSPEQDHVLGLLRACGDRAEVWRPSDWQEIKTLLEGGS